MTLPKYIVERIIRRLLHNEDYRVEVVPLINEEFLQYSIDFFKEVVEAKFNDTDINFDWYKKHFLDPRLKPQDIAIHAGLNMKTISNMYHSAARKVVIDASNKHYDELYESIEKLATSEEDIEINLSISFKQVRVDLNLSESLVVINSLAVKRAALRGGLWSAAGKGVEKPLMHTLCMLYRVPTANYADTVDEVDDLSHEVDFYLKDGSNNYRCEVKLMGKGNPESADVAGSRESKVFIAEKLSGTKIKQLNEKNVEWIQFRRDESLSKLGGDKGFRKFEEVLTTLNIPHNKNLPEDLEEDLERIFNELLS